MPFFHEVLINIRTNILSSLDTDPCAFQALGSIMSKYLHQNLVFLLSVVEYNCHRLQYSAVRGSFS